MPIILIGSTLKQVLKTLAIITIRDILEQLILNIFLLIIRLKYIILKRKVL